jgi:hypothetical protein
LTKVGIEESDIGKVRIDMDAKGKEHMYWFEVVGLVLATPLLYLGCSYLLLLLMADYYYCPGSNREPPLIAILVGVFLSDALWTALIIATRSIRGVRVRVYLSVLVYGLSASILTALYAARFFRGAFS